MWWSYLVSSHPFGANCYSRSQTLCLSSPWVASHAGHLRCLNHFFLDSPFISFPADPGNLGTPTEFWLWEGKCGVCGTLCQQISALFCANFATSRMCWQPCRSVWGGKCYMPHWRGSFFCFELNACSRW